MKVIVGVLNQEHQMAYLLLAVASIVMFVGVAKVSGHAQPGHAVPWRQLLVWAVLFAGGLPIWLLSPRIHGVHLTRPSARWQSDHHRPIPRCTSNAHPL
jgi:hypothetical protein